MHKKPNESIFGRMGRAIKLWKSTHRRLHFSPVTLSVAGLALLTAAAWTVGMGWGLAAGGLSCFILEWRIGEK